MNYLYWLSQIQASGQSLVAEQVFILSQLLQQDYPIISGLVLSNSLFTKFIASIDDSRFLVSNLANSSLHLDIDDYRILQATALKSRQAIDETEFPQQWQEEILAAVKQLNATRLVVRPFFFSSHYSQQDNYSLWRAQTCLCSSEALTLAIKKVWSEAFSAKSLLYWDKLNIPLEAINCTVLIQPIYNAIASGVVELKPKTICIQATWGLGYSLYQGEVEPDIYIVERATGKILSQKLGNKIRAYRLQTAQDSESLIDCLESYFLPESQSETYSLTEADVNKLANLTETLIKKRPQLRYLEWTLSDTESKANATPEFYWTQLNYFSSLSSPQENLSITTTETSVKPLFTGLGVSPGKTVAKVVVHDKLSIDKSSLPDGCILVTKAIAPIQIALLPKISGIITEQGGITSHAAILARELGIPAIVNANRATTILQTGDLVMLDGDLGEVHTTDIYYHSQNSQKKQSPIISKSLKNDVLMIPQPLATRIMVNLNHSNTIDQTMKLPIDGVGLLRAELMLLKLLSSHSLDQWLASSHKREFLEHLTNLIRKFVVAFFPRPVFYRSLDWRSSEFNHSQELELNPIVGDRGTYHHLLDSTLFDLELEAIATIQQEGYTNINLILPFVRSVEEFIFCRQRVANFGLQKTAAFQLWIMAEVPSVIFLLPQYIEAGVQGIVIGANDLTQLILGVDREHSDFSRRGLNVNHPAVLDAIAKLSQTAKKHNIPCSIAIHNPVEYPDLLDKLIQWGISTISVESEAVISTYQEIARSEKRLLLNMMRDRNNSRE
ncbi:MAG: PEP/pyruvate-binding domain-containing protein [Xenococcaceae cyanobacterium MO_234.B1]|nr:PEP/pyruvate-binding domain-containing protein [Xenococcaceae cyanobacterium MO_234.B1]